MRIPSLLSLRVEDFPSQKEWIDKLLFPLNQFIQATVTSINGNITFGDNIAAQTTTLSFVYSGASDFPKSIAWTFPQVNPLTPAKRLTRLIAFSNSGYCSGV